MVWKAVVQRMLVRVSDSKVTGYSRVAVYFFSTLTTHMAIH